MASRTEVLPDPATPCGGKAAAVRELRIEHWMIFVKFFPKLIGNHFEPSAKPSGIELDRIFATDNAVAFIPPGRVGIAHDFADALIEQERLNWSKEGEDQFETH